MFIGLFLETGQADLTACYCHKGNLSPQPPPPSRARHWFPLLTLCLQWSQIPLSANSIHWNSRKHTQAFCQVGFLLFCWVNLTHRRVCWAPDPAQERSQVHVCEKREEDGKLSAGHRRKPLSKLGTAYREKRSAVCETTTPFHSKPDLLTPVPYLQWSYF